MNTHILLISQDVMGKRMAGPGIRYFHMARVLSQHFLVTVAVTFSVDAQIESDLAYLQEQLPNADLLPYQPGDWTQIMLAADSAQVLILASDLAAMLPGLADHPAALVIDGYDPLLAEWLAMEVPRQPPGLMDLWRLRMKQIQPQYTVGDYFICASERQRDWWIGLLEANGRLNPWTFGQDPSLRSLVDVVSYGLPDGDPQYTRPVIKGVWPGIKPSDKLVLWGGGLWRWLDPLTAIQAIALVGKSRSDVRLVFPGTKHPNPILTDMPTFNEEAKALADELGLLDKVVFFGDWIAYTDWENVLLEADLGLSLHFDSLETHLANRSRTLEFIWAGLPVVTTGLETTSELISKEQLGIIVPVGDVDSVAEAIHAILASGERIQESSLRKVKETYRWEQALLPLIRFCENPKKASDRQLMGSELGNPAHVGIVPELERWKQHAANLIIVRDDLIQSYAKLNFERDKLAEQVEEYKSGRFIKVMASLDRVKRRLINRDSGQDIAERPSSNLEQ